MSDSDTWDPDVHGSAGSQPYQRPAGRSAAPSPGPIPPRNNQGWAPSSGSAPGTPTSGPTSASAPTGQGVSPMNASRFPQGHNPGPFHGPQRGFYQGPPQGQWAGQPQQGYLPGAPASQQWGGGAADATDAGFRPVPTGEHPSYRRAADTNYPNAAPMDSGYQPYPQLNYTPDTQRYNTYQVAEVAARPGAPAWVWAALAGILILVGVVFYLAIGPSSGDDDAGGDRTTSEASPVESETSNPEPEDSEEEQSSTDLSAVPDPSDLPNPPHSYAGYGPSWDSLETIPVGETTDVVGETSDSQEWEFTVTDVEFGADTSDVPDLDPAPEGYEYVRAEIEATNIEGSDSGPWVNFIVSFGVNENEIYDETVCWEKCLNRAQPDANGTYRGDLYFLIPEGTTDGYLLINPLFGGVDDFRVEVS